MLVSSKPTTPGTAMAFPPNGCGGPPTHVSCAPGVSHPYIRTGSASFRDLRRMWATILQVETPACSWCRHASANYPDVGLRVVSYYARSGGNALEVVEMDGKRWPEIVKDIKGISSVDEVEVLDSS